MVNSDIGEALFTWFNSVRNKNFQKNDPILKEKAKHFVNLLNKLDFRPEMCGFNGSKINVVLFLKQFVVKMVRKMSQWGVISWKLTKN